MRLLLTRPVEEAQSLKQKLEAEGFEVFCLPLIEISPPLDGGALLKKAIDHIDCYDWLILTSQNTVRALQPNLKKIPARLQIAAVGKATAEAARRAGWKAVTPQREDGAEGLIEFFEDKTLQEKRILYPRSQIGMQNLVAALLAQGARVDVIEAYQTKLSSVSGRELQGVLEKGVEGILFYSPSAVSGFFRKVDKKNPILKKIALIPLGKTTAFVLRNEGFRPAFVPSRPDEDSFSSEIKKFFTNARE